MIQLDFIQVIKNYIYSNNKLEILERGEGMGVSVLSSGNEIKFIIFILKLYTRM